MEKLFQYFSINPAQAMVYQFLLSNGASTMAQIAQGIAHKRPSCQEYVRALEQLGFVNVSRDSGKTLYQAEDPDKFLQIVHERAEVVEELMPLLTKHQRSLNLIHFRTVEPAESVRILNRWKRKKLYLKEFKNKVAAVTTSKTQIILYQPHENYPAIEITSSEIATFHQDII